MHADRWSGVAGARAQKLGYAAFSRYVCILRICRAASGGRISVKLGSIGDLVDIIKYSKFYESKSRGFRFLGSKIAASHWNVKSST